MRKVEKLLSDWILSDKAMEASKEIRASQLDADNHEMILLHKLEDFIDRSPKNPEKLFQSLMLPIEKIKVDAVSGSGFKRTFEWEGKKFSRPELVAKSFYEAKGYKVSWSEGVAFSLALDALQYELADRLKENFDVAPRKIYTDNELELLINGNNAAKERILELNEREKNRPAMLKAGGRDAAKVLAPAFRTLLSKKAETNFDHIEEWLKYKCTRDEIKEIFFETLKDVVHNKPADSLIQWLPSLSELQSGNQNDKWKYTEWSILFAKELLTEFPRSFIYNYILERGGFQSQRFDLSLFNLENGEIKFVEVKLDDNLTKMQIVDLKLSFMADMNIGLAVIETP